MLAMTLTTEELAGTAVGERGIKGRASEGAAGGAAEGRDRAAGNWKTIGAVAADIVARCQKARIQMPCA